jgi:hypothetical protein
VPEANFLPARALRRRWSALRIMRELALCNTNTFQKSCHTQYDLCKNVHQVTDCDASITLSLDSTDVAASPLGRCCYTR